MRRLALAIACCAGLLAGSVGAGADLASDQDMANRYLRAARSGDDDAQFYLGALYSAGVGVPRSDEEAFRWFARAADQGHSHAMLIVSGLYAIGRGVAKDEAGYRYLAESIRMHPDQETLKGMMQAAGFERCDYFNLSGGIVALHRGFKL